MNLSVNFFGREPKTPIAITVDSLKDARSKLSGSIFYETSALEPRRDMAEQAYGAQMMVFNAVERLKVLDPDGTLAVRRVLASASNTSGAAGARILAQDWNGARGLIASAGADILTAVAMLEQLDG